MQEPKEPVTGIVQVCLSSLNTAALNTTTNTIKLKSQEFFGTSKGKLHANWSSKDRHLSVAGALYSSKAMTAFRPGFVAETDRDCLKTYYVMFLVLILLFETEIYFPVNLFCVYIPYCACCCWSCHLLKLLLKYFFPRKALNKASVKIIVFDSLFTSFDPSKILWEPLKIRVKIR